MIRANFAVAFALATVLCAGLACAQAAPPQNAVSSQSARATNPANQGRLQLDQYLDSLAAQFEANRATAVAAIHTRAQAEARQAKVRGQILSLIGAFPQRTPLNAKVMGETPADGFRIRKVLFESQPKFYVTALLYVPDGRAADGKRGPRRQTFVAGVEARRHPHDARPRGQAAKPAMRPSPRSSPVTASSCSPTIPSDRVSACNIPIQPNQARHWLCALQVNTAKPVSSPCSSAKPLPSTKFGTPCAAWIISLRFPRSIRIASVRSAAPAEEPSPRSPALSIRASPPSARLATSPRSTRCCPRWAAGCRAVHAALHLFGPRLSRLDRTRRAAPLRRHLHLLRHVSFRRRAQHSHRGAPLLFALRSGERRYTSGRRAAFRSAHAHRARTKYRHHKSRVSAGPIAVDHRPRPPRRAHAHHGQHRQLLHPQSAARRRCGPPRCSRRRQPASCDGFDRRHPQGSIPDNPTGQVATSFPGCATVFTLNQKARGADCARAPAVDRV